METEKENSAIKKYLILHPNAKETEINTFKKFMQGGNEAPIKAAGNRGEK